MRVRIIFLLKNKGASLPFHHQYILNNFFNSIVTTGGKSAYSSFKMYNFSGLKGQTKVSKSGLHYFSSRVTVVLSTPDEGFVNFFLSRLFELETVTIGNLILKPEYVEKEDLPELKDMEKYICISPMVIINPVNPKLDPKQFLSPEMDKFSDLLYESTIARMAQTNNYTEAQLESFYKFQIVPDNGYLQKVRIEEKKFARIYPLYHQEEMYEVRGYTFPFTLYAAPEVQKFIFYNGLGELTFKGFGMVDIANAETGRKLENYNFAAVAE